jgi:hypothetical protein
MLQNVDLNTVLLVGVACVLLCGVGIVLFFGMQFIGTALSAVTTFAQMFMHILSGGPVAWCGCLLLLMSCVVCAGIGIFIVNVLPQCSGPNAVNFCRLLGR